MNLSFFLYYLHKSLVAANSIESFRYRLTNNKVFIYDTINASPTINRDDGTFGFAYMEYNSNFTEFSRLAKSEIERIKHTAGLHPAVSGENVIHYSSLPWLNFSSLSHASNSTFKDSCPKITFGKMLENDGKRTMPVSIHVHHALMDGFDVGCYVEKFQKLMNE